MSKTRRASARLVASIGGAIGHRPRRTAVLATLFSVAAASVVASATHEGPLAGAIHDRLVAKPRVAALGEPGRRAPFAPPAAPEAADEATGPLDEGIAEAVRAVPPGGTAPLNRWAWGSGSSSSGGPGTMPQGFAQRPISLAGPGAIITLADLVRGGAAGRAGGAGASGPGPSGTGGGGAGGGAVGGGGFGGGGVPVDTLDGTLAQVALPLEEDEGGDAILPTTPDVRVADETPLGKTPPFSGFEETDAAAVPVPAAALLFPLGLAALFRARRRA